MKVKIARRTDISSNVQGQNIEVTTKDKLGGYYAQDPVCTAIAALSGTGLVEYDCDNTQVVAQYVTFSQSSGTVMTICEAEVWVEEVPGQSPKLPT